MGAVSSSRLAHRSQMAAQNGHIELCRFLLRETSFPADHAVLSSALEDIQEHTWHSYLGTDETLLEAFYRLLVGEYHLDVDLLNSPTSLVGICQLTHTEASFGVVLASQPTPFADLSLAQKFPAIIEAVGWPADAFATILHGHDPIEVVMRTTEDGKTALHWAAAHLGQWLRMVFDIHDKSYFSRRTKSYAKLVSDLVRMGANAHAEWHDKAGGLYYPPSLQNYDPFLSLFKGVNLMSRPHWSRHCMVYAVSLWGQVLVEGGVDLHEYIVTENEFLESIQWSDMDIPSSGVYDGLLAPVKLFLSSDSTLAVIIREISCVTIWKAQATHVPGAWPASPLFVDTIIWSPGWMDECYGFDWVVFDTVNVNTHPYTKAGDNQIDARRMSSVSDELMHDSIIDAEQERPWEPGPQDDHGLLARVLDQETRYRHSGRRSLSAPPLQDRRARLKAEWTDVAVALPLGGAFTLHKCPLDSRWHKRSGYFDFSCYRRDCLQGRCHELHNSVERDDAATFEGWFLRDDDHVHVAKRYAQKFCPEKMHIVEETLGRATDRARLAMGPKRPGDAGIP
jgi:hypothetical protein